MFYNVCNINKDFLKKLSADTFEVHGVSKTMFTNLKVYKFL